jgi:hypothetical protein
MSLFKGDIIITHHEKIGTKGSNKGCIHFLESPAVLTQKSSSISYCDIDSTKIAKNFSFGKAVKELI